MDNLSLNAVARWPLRKQLIIHGALFFLLFLVGYWWFISGLSTELEEEKVKEVELKQQFEMIVKKRMILANELSHYTNLKEKLTNWKDRLVLHHELPVLLDQILKFSAANNVKISLFNPDEEVKEGDYHKVPINIIAVGNYHELASFISDLANMQKIVVINRLIISNENKADVLGGKLANDANAANLLTAEILLEIYINVGSKKNA